MCGVETLFFVEAFIKTVTMASNRLRKSEVDDVEETRQLSLSAENAIFEAIIANDSKALASILSSDPTAIESVNSYVLSSIALRFLS